METSSKTTVRPRAVPFALLADPAFRRVWMLGALAGTMRWLDMLVVGIWVFDTTASPLAVAVVTLLRLLPMLVGVFVGAFAERVALRSFLTAALCFLAVVYGVLGLLAFTGVIQLWHVALGSFVAGLYWSTEMSVRRTLAGEIAGPERMSAAMALDWGTFSITRTIGPLVGGALYTLIGLGGTYAIGFGLFALATVLALRLPVGQAARGARSGPIFTTIRDGFRTARARPVILGTLAVTVCLNFWGFPYSSMVPVIGKDVLHGSPIQVGLLNAAEGIGALIGSIALAGLARNAPLARVYICGSALVLFGALGFALSSVFEISLGVLILLGIGSATFATMQSTIMLTHAPADQQSRMMGVLSTCIGLGQIGHLHLGILADWLGAPTALAVSTLEGMVVLALCIWLWPAMIRR